MQASRDEQTVNWKLLELLADDQKDNIHLYLSCISLEPMILDKSAEIDNYINFPKIIAVFRKITC